MGSLAAIVRRLGTDLVRRIATKVGFDVSSLKRRGRSRVRHTVRPFGASIAVSDKTQVQTLGERLGFGPRARLLIVHADDLGLAQAVNTAFIDGLETGLINSGSAMVPCPRFSEVASFAQAHPDTDIGLHLTLTSESAMQRWAPIASQAQVPTLVDQQGYLLQEWTPETPVDPGEVEIELRAQIEKAYAAGLRPTHLDSHQFRLQLGRRDLFEAYLGLAREYQLPVLLSREWFSRVPHLQASLTPRDLVLDRIVTISSRMAPEQWPAFYRRVLEELPPGVTELLIHPGYDNEELRAFFEGRLPWGAAWRQRDFEFLTSDEFRVLLANNDIKLINWRAIASRLAS